MCDVFLREWLNIKMLAFSAVEETPLLPIVELLKYFHCLLPPYTIVVFLITGIMLRNFSVTLFSTALLFGYFASRLPA